MVFSMRLVGATSIVVETTFSDRNRGLLPAPCHSTLTHDVSALCSPTFYELSRSWLGWYVPSWANETRARDINKLYSGKATIMSLTWVACQILRNDKVPPLGLF